MVINTGGNVGIGTTAPNAKLEVAGGHLLMSGGGYVRGLPNAAATTAINDPTMATSKDYVDAAAGGGCYPRTTSETVSYDGFCNLTAIGSQVPPACPVGTTDQGFVEAYMIAAAMPVGGCFGPSSGTTVYYRVCCK